MAQIRYWIGSAGPFVVEDTDIYADNPALTMLPLRIEGQAMITEAPSADNHVVRKVDLTTTINKVEVANIDAPNLTSYAGSQAGDLLIVWAPGNPSEYTIYAWDTEDPAEANPYVCAGDGGKWTAIGGKYSTCTQHFHLADGTSFSISFNAILSFLIKKSVSKPGLTYVGLTNENGDMCYIYPNSTGNGIKVTTVEPV